MCARLDDHDHGRQIQVMYLFFRTRIFLFGGQQQCFLFVLVPLSLFLSLSGSHLRCCLVLRAFLLRSLPAHTKCGCVCVLPNFLEKQFAHLRKMDCGTGGAPLISAFHAKFKSSNIAAPASPARFQWTVSLPAPPLFVPIAIAIDRSDASLASF